MTEDLLLTNYLGTVVCFCHGGCNTVVKSCMMNEDFYCQHIKSPLLCVYAVIVVTVFKNCMTEDLLSTY